jgi:hypothetical protein
LKITRKIDKLEKFQYSAESLIVDFDGDNNLIEVTPRTKGNLPSSITGRAAVWVTSEVPGATAYHLRNPLDNYNFLAIEYLNDQWYYLHWCKERYYTKSLSQIQNPINLGLETCSAPAIEGIPALNHSESTSDASKGN